MTAAATATSRIRLGLDVTPLPRCRPQVVATAVAARDRLSQGRVTLGVGLGGVVREFEAFTLAVELQQLTRWTDQRPPTFMRAKTPNRPPAHPLLNRGSVLAALGHPSVESYVAAPGREIARSGMVTSSELPTLTVRTDDGYDPPLELVMEWVIDRTNDRADG